MVEKLRSKALPLEQRFWDDLMSSSKRWGLAVYEQDWLHNEWEGLHATLQSATLGRTWLLQMGLAASKSNLTIQYCMAYPRFALASAEVHSVDQIRVTDDYAVQVTQPHPQAYTHAHRISRAGVACRSTLRARAHTRSTCTLVRRQCSRRLSASPRPRTHGGLDEAFSRRTQSTMAKPRRATPQSKLPSPRAL